MSGDDRSALSRDHDAVRRAYRSAGFRDEPPAAVDAAIIAASRRSTRPKVRALFAPVAMAATVLLAFGLVLRLTMPASDLTEQAVDRAREVPPASVDEPAPARATAPATAPAVAPSAESAAAVSGLADAPTRDFESAGRTELQTTAAEAPLARGCAALHDGEPDPWLACIRARIDAGDLDVARAELEAFTRAHPDAVVPAAIGAQLGP